jgi:N-acetylmuramoyl-L-alanine amidase
MNMNRISITTLLLLAMVLTSFEKNNEPERNDGKYVVVLDAGHGGHDPGNLGNGYLEKNIALNIVLKIGEILETNPNVKVVYTRKDDTFVDLYVRGEIANKANADLFVSVHCDSHSSDAHGAGTFVLGLHANKQNFEIAKKENSVIYLEDNYEDRYADYDINSPESVIGLTIMQEEFLDQSIALAKMIQDNFSGKLKRNNREVKQAGFIVLHQTFMPSVLVETGFLTNKSEGAYLNSTKGQSQMGTAIAEAILNYNNGILENIIQTLPQTTQAEEVEKEIALEKEDVSQNSDEEPIRSDNPIDNKEVKKEIDPKKTIVEDVPKTEKIVKTVEKAPSKDAGAKEEKSIPIKKIVKPKSTVNIIFKVQLMASAKDLDLKPGNFNGLGRLSKEPFKNMYRYMYGITNSYEEAKMLKSNADLKGYVTSYIVAYKDRERISVTEALKYVSE